MKRLVERDLYFVQDDLWRISYLDAYNAVIECGLYEYIRDNEIYSYMFSIPSEKSVEFAKVFSIADRRVGHSGASYGITMRMVEQIIKQGFDRWKIWYIKVSRPDIVHKVKIISRQIKKSLSEPEYKMCRSRLKSEFFYLILPNNI